MFQVSAPFVLLEDARPGAEAARLFCAPRETIVAHRLDEVELALERLRDGVRRGLHAAGWMSYEAGLAFEPRLIERAAPKGAIAFPLLWFGLFERMERLAPGEVARALPDAAGAWIGAPRPRVSRADYDAAFQRAKDYIVAGDIYQVNLSYRADVPMAGAPLAAYARLRDAGQGGWSGAVFDGAHWLLSTSPELFFRLRDGVIEARPMKGTAKRRLDADEDAAAAAALALDEKERAENVMIVDLIRNDLSRIAARVRTPALFTVETYPTLHTLTSTVRGDLKHGRDAIDVLRALFPCGSITGAPKIRAMEIIRELEGDRRGAYTGSIGWISPDGDAEFNVAIRTLAIDAQGAEIGLGSAVVYDSTADGEWEECRTKSAFLTRGAPELALIETMRLQNGALWRRDLHMARLAASASALGFEFEQARVDAALAQAISQHDGVVRLTLSADGAVTATCEPARRFASDVVSIAVVRRPVAADDFRLRHKTTSRSFYDEARLTSGADEVLFVDDDGFVTEGSFTNIFVERDGVLLTPPAGRGLLPGILRAALLESGEVREQDVRLDDLADGFFVGNAVRGLSRAALRLDRPQARRARRRGLEQLF